MSLVTLVEHALGRKRGFVLFLGMIGAAFFFGDAMITPAISVLSAVEGLKVINPGFEAYVVPATIAVLASLFAVQYRGTAGMARFFAPVTALWFIIIAAMGIAHIAHDPEILLAFNPAAGLVILTKHPGLALLISGRRIPGRHRREALYADMGHFGKSPIRLGWFAVVFPGLALNYLGQGALIHADPAAISNPFYLMAPGWALIPWSAWRRW